MWFFSSVVFLALIAGVFWAYKKKRERQKAEHARRLDALLSEVKLSSGISVAPKPAVALENAGFAAAPGSKVVRKPRLLPQTDALLYYVFRMGLPDHEIFANMTLADLVDVSPSMSGHEREQSLRRLAQQRMTLVICNKQLEVTAAVMTHNGALPEAVQAVNTRFTEECLTTAGIRLVRVPAGKPLRHQQVRELVYGASG
jgi:hypothetical protein